MRRLVFGPAAEFERHIGYYAAAFEADGYAPRDELAYVSCGAPGLQISRFALGVWLRNQAVRLMAIPGLANLMVGGQMRDDFEPPRYSM